MAKRETDYCPNCGAEFRAGKLACPECGSDAQTGWKDAEEIEYQSVEIPDYLGDEFDEKPRGMGRPWTLVGLVLAILGMALFVFMR